MPTANYTKFFSEIVVDMTSYPIFDEDYRAGLNAKIQDHYKYREIGFEDDDVFKHYFKMRMNEIMPYYNQRYASTLIAIDPKLMQKITDTYEKTNTGSNTQTNNLTTQVNATVIEDRTDVNSGTNTGTVTTAGGVKDVQSDTPQAILDMADITSNLYASKLNLSDVSNTVTNALANGNTITVDGTNTTDSTATNTGTVGNVGNNTENYTRTLSGYTGMSEAELIVKYRESFINVDMEIIRDLASLFVGIE